MSESDPISYPTDADAAAELLDDIAPEVPDAPTDPVDDPVDPAQPLDPG